MRPATTVLAIETSVGTAKRFLGIIVPRFDISDAD
jgi:hypothetical protein